MSKQNVSYPTKLTALYTLAAAVLIPWIIYLSISLPDRNIARHWDAAWVGFDSFLLFLIVLTSVYAYRKSARVIPAASALASLLIVDAWIDVVTARPGFQQREALFFALVIELPLAFITIVLVHRTLSSINWDKQDTIIIGNQPEA